MNEDFYSIPQPRPVQSNSPQTQTPAVQTSTNQVDSSGAFLFDFSQIFMYLNTFALAWTMFYSVVQVSSFYFSYVKYHGGEMESMKKGKKYLYNAFKLWYSYLLTLGFFVLYLGVQNTFFGPIVGVLGVLVYGLKFLGIDLSLIPVFDTISDKVQKGLIVPLEFFNSMIVNAMKPAGGDSDKKKFDKK
jgi:hypothetical protein